MRLKQLAKVFLIIILAAPLYLTAKDKIVIQVRLFHSTWIEGQPGLQRSEILTTLSHPELSSIKENLSGSEFELKIAVIDTLLQVFDLSTLDDIFLHKKQWNGLGEPLIKDRVFGGEDTIVYEIKLSPKKLSSQQIALHLAISGGKINPDNFDGDLESVLDQDLILDVDDPAIVSLPHKNGAYFVMVAVTRGTLAEVKPKPKKADDFEFVPAPRALQQVQPFYPRELRRRRLGGKIGLRITIDKKGVVQNVAVVKSLHPYHNYSAVQAFLQWKFEPVLLKGAPIPAMFSYIYKYDPWMYRRERTWSDTLHEKPDASSREKLRQVLAGSGDYCQKLKSAVFDFICEETIKETHYNILNNIKWGGVAWGPRRQQTAKGTFFVSHSIKPSDDIRNSAASESRAVLSETGGEVIRRDNLAPSKPTGSYMIQIIDPQRTLRNNFLCDYQIIKKANSIKEQRIVLKENGQKAKEKKNLLEERRFSGVSSLFAPIRVLAQDGQSKFDYRIIDEKKVQGQKTWVIEAVPKFGNEDEIWSARIWVDKKSFQIRKCEIKGIPIDGYEDVLNDCAKLNIKPDFKMTHEYRTEKNKILFPFRSEIRVAYPGIGTQRAVTKINMSLSYDKYKFFTVETDHKIIK